MTCTAFDGFRRIAVGELDKVAVEARRALESGAAGPVLIFDDTTGRVIDLDMRLNEDAMLAALEPPARERGRPKLGVVAREVTLLPRHWDWLKEQPGGASVALRKLVEEARRANGEKDRLREQRDATYRFMSAMAGDLPDFEEASRALFMGDRERFEALIGKWPEDVRNHLNIMPPTANS